MGAGSDIDNPDAAHGFAALDAEVGFVQTGCWRLKQHYLQKSLTIAQRHGRIVLDFQVVDAVQSGMLAYGVTPKFIAAEIDGHVGTAWMNCSTRRCWVRRLV